jgi:serine/threonine protein phosphatase PrpC
VVAALPRGSLRGAAATAAGVDELSSAAVGGSGVGSGVGRGQGVSKPKPGAKVTIGALFNLAPLPNLEEVYLKFCPPDTQPLPPALSASRSLGVNARLGVVMGGHQSLGRRVNQEDRLLLCPRLSVPTGSADSAAAAAACDPRFAMAAVFDGHGGAEVAEFLRTHLEARLSRALRDEGRYEKRRARAALRETQTQTRGSAGPADPALPATGPTGVAAAAAAATAAARTRKGSGGTAVAAATAAGARPPLAAEPTPAAAVGSAFPASIIAPPLQCTYAPGEPDFRRLFSFVLQELDADVLAEARRNPDRIPATAGTCAVAATFYGDALIVANVGDCEAVLCRGGQPYELTCPHKASRDTEVERIRRTHGRILPYRGGWRVDGALAVARSIGMLQLKFPEYTGLIPDPFVRVVQLRIPNGTVIPPPPSLTGLIHAPSIGRSLAELSHAAQLAEERHEGGSSGSRPAARSSFGLDSGSSLAPAASSFTGSEGISIGLRPRSAVPDRVRSLLKHEFMSGTFGHGAGSGQQHQPPARAGAMSAAEGQHTAATGDPLAGLVRPTRLASLREQSEVADASPVTGRPTIAPEGIAGVRSAETSPAETSPAAAASPSVDPWFDSDLTAVPPVPASFGAQYAYNSENDFPSIGRNHRKSAKLASGGDVVSPGSGGGDPSSHPRGLLDVFPSAVLRSEVATDAAANSSSEVSPHLAITPEAAGSPPSAPDSDSDDVSSIESLDDAAGMSLLASAGPRVSTPAAALAIASDTGRDIALVGASAAATNKTATTDDAATLPPPYPSAGSQPRLPTSSPQSKRLSAGFSRSGSQQQQQDEFVVLASDGLWDVWPNRQELMNRIKKSLRETLDVDETCRQLVEESVDSRRADDNVSMALIVLNQHSVFTATAGALGGTVGYARRASAKKIHPRARRDMHMSQDLASLSKTITATPASGSGGGAARPGRASTAGVSAALSAATAVNAIGESDPVPGHERSLAGSRSLAPNLRIRPPPLPSDFHDKQAPGVSTSQQTGAGKRDSFAIMHSSFSAPAARPFPAEFSFSVNGESADDQSPLASSGDVSSIRSGEQPGSGPAEQGTARRRKLTTPPSSPLTSGAYLPQSGHPVAAPPRTKLSSFIEALSRVTGATGKGRTDSNTDDSGSHADEVGFLGLPSAVRGEKEGDLSPDALDEDEGIAAMDAKEEGEVLEDAFVVVADGGGQMVVNAMSSTSSS